MNGAVRYEGMPYALEKLDVRLWRVSGGFADSQQPSYVEIEPALFERCFRRECGFEWPGRYRYLIYGAPVAVEHECRWSILLLLTQIFPLEEGVSYERRSLNSVLKVNILLSADIKNPQITEELDIRGGCRLKDVVLKQ